MLSPAAGQKNSVLTALQNALTAFDANNSAVQTAMSQAFPDPAQRESSRQQIVANLRTAYQQASAEVTDPKWFTPHQRLAVLAQSAMNSSAKQEPVRAMAFGSVAPALAEAPFEQFGPLDLGWIECVVDGFKTLLEGDAPFVQHRELTDFLFHIKDQMTVALVSDWGANNDSAKLVAAQIKAANPDILIHLGDIYYAGQQNEALEMLDIWPQSTLPGKSFAMNGNHEMYSGGRAYFETVLPRFGQPASYFGLRNNYWQILAFDSAYVEQRLLPPDEATGKNAGLKSQWDWLVDKMQNSPLPTIFLSHHQPVSAYQEENDDAQNLRSDFAQFQTAAGRPVFGWFFGHEHRCTLYDDPNIPYFARLIGNGCIPHTAPPDNQEPEDGCYSFSKMNTGKNAKGDAFSGFALLRFNAGIIDISYKNEDGSLFWKETWEAPPPV